jgi:hypothetical protein
VSSATTETLVVAIRFEPERRQWERSLLPDQLRKIRIRLGSDVAVLNVSRSGILIEGSVRLRPGYPVTLQMSSPSEYLEAHVARCEVSQLNHVGVIYRAGLMFARPVTATWLKEELNAGRSWC